MEISGRKVQRSYETFKYTPPSFQAAWYSPKGGVERFSWATRPNGEPTTVFNLVVSSMGSSFLPVPWSLKQIGLIPGVLLIILDGYLVYYTSCMLLDSSGSVSSLLHPPRHAFDTPPILPYAVIARKSFGGHSDNLVKCTMAVTLFGFLIGPAIATNQLVKNAVQLMYTGFHESVFFSPPVFNAIQMFIIFIMSLPRNLSELRFTSMIGTFACFYLVFAIFWKYITLCHSNSTCFWNDRDDELMGFSVFWNLGFDLDSLMRFLNAWPILLYCLTNQPFILTIMQDVEYPSPKRTRKIILWSNFIIGSLFAGVGIFGYLLFLEDTNENIFLNDYGNSYIIALAELLLSFCCIVSAPVQINIIRQIVGINALPNHQHIAVTSILCFILWLFASTVPQITDAFGFVGATVIPVIGFILPAFMLSEVTQKRHKSLTAGWVIAISIGFISTICLFLQILSYL